MDCGLFLSGKPRPVGGELHFFYKRAKGGDIVIDKDVQGEHADFLQTPLAGKTAYKGAGGIRQAGGLPTAAVTSRAITTVTFGSQTC